MRIRNLLNVFLAVFSIVSPIGNIRARFNLNKGLAANGNLLENPEDFWCPRHWKFIVDSQCDIKTAIDPMVAVMGVGQALNIKYDYELSDPIKGACEMIPKDILDGIFE